MAVSSHEKELLKNIYEENKVLFQKMFEVLTEDDDEEKKQILTALNNINKKFKVNKWLYNGNIYTSKELLKIIIEEQLTQGKTIEDLSKYKLGRDVMVSKNNLKEGYYDEYSFEDITYFVRNNRLSDDIKFMIKDLGLDIKQIEE